MTERDNILKDSLKRVFVLLQLFKFSLQELQQNDLIKEWARIAKENKNKSFVDLREVAVIQIRALDSFMLKSKQTMRPETFNQVINVLNNEQIKEISLLLDQITLLSEDSIESITNEVKLMIQNARTTKDNIDSNI